ELYSPAQIESAVRHVFGPDTQLIADSTYFVVTTGERLAACGGWSRRRSLYGGDQMKAGEDSLLDPATEPARIRAFFVAPEFARQGLGTQLLEASLTAARAAGFQTAELVATLPGERLYAAHGFETIEPVMQALPDGLEILFVRMRRNHLAAG
ncbi:MAG TPA: GNAT family N-acetyltransferase, partial [Candidatus Limnocylindria bacterium]|nr:GNAT family N-acetyltransferase [Candidatus Limnocylindria bacterium]